MKVYYKRGAIVLPPSRPWQVFYPCPGQIPDYAPVMLPRPKKISAKYTFRLNIIMINAKTGNCKLFNFDNF